MKTRPGLLLLSVAVAVVASTPAIACMCIPRSYDDMAADATVVFVGTVRSTREHLLSAGRTVRFSVLEERRGDIGSKVSVQLSPHACGFEFTAGSTYVVFAREYGATRFLPGYLETSGCSALRYRQRDDSQAAAGAPTRARAATGRARHEARVVRMLFEPAEVPAAYRCPLCPSQATRPIGARCLTPRSAPRHRGNP